MKIAILGSGGREHALALQISKSKKLDKIYCIPGNAGTNLIGKNIKIQQFHKKATEEWHIIIFDNNNGGKYINKHQFDK